VPDDRPREEENRGESDGEVISGRGQRAERSHWPKTSKPPELRVCSRAEFHSRARPLDVNHDVRFILIYVYPYMYSDGSFGRAQDKRRTAATDLPSDAVFIHIYVYPYMCLSDSMRSVA